MSDPLRIAAVVEGPTDRIFLTSVLRAILGELSFRLTQLQPEGSAAFGTLGAGWAGVYRWCHQAAIRGGGRLTADAILFSGFDLLLLQLDAEVAAEHYANGSITPGAPDLPLPCDRPCPPPKAATDALRKVLLSWCGEATTPPKVIVCIPSRTMEAWVVASLFPNDQLVRRGIECLSRPESRLANQPKAKRLKKNQRHYQARSAVFQAEWTRLAANGGLEEAHRFDREVRACVERLRSPGTDVPNR